MPKTNRRSSITNFPAQRTNPYTYGNIKNILKKQKEQMKKNMNKLNTVTKMLKKMKK